MADTHEQRIQKVRTLYERSNVPGERAAAWEALQRLLKSEQEDAINWLERAKEVLVSKGYYMCLACGDTYLYSKVSEKVWLKLIDKKSGVGEWDYIHAAAGKKFIPPNTTPDKRGKSIEQLSQIL